MCHTKPSAAARAAQTAPRDAEELHAGGRGRPPPTVPSTRPHAGGGGAGAGGGKRGGGGRGEGEEVDGDRAAGLVAAGVGRGIKDGRGAAAPGRDAGPPHRRGAPAGRRRAKVRLGARGAAG